jgi:autotransporter-associated beta strand protein
MGGAVFVMQGASLVIEGAGSLTGSSITKGTAGAGGTGGQAFGAGLFLEGSGTLSFQPGAAETETISDTIADEAGVVANGYASPAGFTPGSYSLVKSALGTLVLSGPNTYAGVTSVKVGTVQAGSDAGFSKFSAFTVSNGATLDINGHNVTIGSLADGTGAGTVMNCGPMGSTLTTGGDNSNTTFSGTIEDDDHALALTKAGTGTFRLARDNNYTGDTSVLSGTLLVDGSIANSASDVKSGATLGGTGTTGTVTVQSGGTLAPGDGPAFSTPAAYRSLPARSSPSGSAAPPPAPAAMTSSR